MKEIMDWFEDCSAFWAEESRQLSSGGRKDEGDLAKARMNVYGICRSVVQVLSEDMARAKLCGLRGEWETALAAAREHNDVKKAVIEEIKLEALSEVLTKLEEV